MKPYSRQLELLKAERTRWAGRFRYLILKGTEEFVRLARKELDKPRHETITAELLPLVASCRWHQRQARRILKTRRLKGRPIWLLGQQHRIQHAPLGTVGIIATWNYPIQLLGIQLLQAAVPGNDVVVKPSEHAPESQAFLLELARKAGLNEPALRCLPATREAGAAMIQNETLDHLVFTGSTKVGRLVAEACASRLLPSTLELSGRDSALVLADADASLAARSIWTAVTANAGQTCMAPRRVLVHQDRYQAFCKALIPLAEEATPRRLTLPEDAARIESQISKAVEDGGRSVPEQSTASNASAFIPRVVLDCPADALLMAGDHFGPALAVNSCQNLEEMLERHHTVGQYLATSIWSQNQRSARAMAAGLRSATVTINDVLIPTAHPGASISGHGLSGWGTSRGAAGLLAMSRPVHVTTTPRKMRVPTEVPSEESLAKLERLIGVPRPGTKNTSKTTPTSPQPNPGKSS
jgi:acyl-CoA reductase-like NAD-dependent aldehyde dehydrogenase